MTLKIAVIGATGLVGHEILNILADDGVPVTQISALTSTRMSGRDISYGDADIKTIDANKFDCNDVDVVFVADNQIDISSIKHAKIINCMGGATATLPNALAMQMIETLSPIHARTPIKRIVVSTYQAASTVGKAGMDELFNQSRKFFVTDGLENDVFSKQISFNVIPQAGQFMDDGQTDGEWQIAADIKKFLDKDIKVSATCVVVPVFIGTGMAINVEFDGDMDAKTVKSLWRDIEDVIVIDEGSEMEFVTPAEIAGEDKVYVSRLRNDQTTDSGVSFWCAADNIRLMAVQAVKAMHAS